MNRKLSFRSSHFLNCSLLICKGPSAFHVCFYQRASQQLQVGVELEVNARMQESAATIAYQVDLPKADLVFKGTDREEGCFLFLAVLVYN